ncbi:hypothetical protein VKT23_012155 [Stygiomarasmius scandens]|uniref:Uncharacterized protein n=1 Tax=Marasmiellus scandens TaxID=2682957 RepID=A0ABR1J7T5_9AGAR
MFQESTLYPLPHRQSPLHEKPTFPVHRRERVPRVLARRVEPYSPSSPPTTAAKVSITLGGARESEKTGAHSRDTTTPLASLKLATTPTQSPVEREKPTCTQFEAISDSTFIPPRY